MTKVELLEALTQMTTQDRLEVIEVATQLIRAELLPDSHPSDRHTLDSATVVEVMQVQYQPNPDFTLFSELNTKNL